MSVVELRSVVCCRKLLTISLSYFTAQNHTPTLWAGTNAGTVFAYQITMPANDKRDSEAVQCQLGKHGAWKMIQFSLSNKRDYNKAATIN